MSSRISMYILDAKAGWLAMLYFSYACTTTLVKQPEDAFLYALSLGLIDGALKYKLAERFSYLQSFHHNLFGCIL